MSETDIDDTFEDTAFEDDEDARLADADASVKGRASSLEKRRLIDNLLEEKRLERSLKDGFDDLDELDDGLDDDWDDDLDDD